MMLKFSFISCNLCHVCVFGYPKNVLFIFRGTIIFNKTSTILVILTAHITLSVATCDTSNSCCMEGHECVYVNEIYSL